MRLTIVKDLAPFKLSALTKIDAGAEAFRANFITLGSGQAMVYQQKEKEAELVSADPEINPALVPHVAAEAQMAGVSMLEAAQVMLTMAHMWVQLSAGIEVTRLSAKQAVGAATNEAEIDLAATIDWYALIGT